MSRLLLALVALAATSCSQPGHLDVSEYHLICVDGVEVVTHDSGSNFSFRMEVTGRGCGPDVHASRFEGGA